MMNKDFHILNGDCLLEQFPEEIKGSRIVCRECLVDGDVRSSDLEEFFQNRAKFIARLHDDVSVEDYYQNAVSEFEKIKEIPSQSNIYLWFEDDLFCQVNFWFVTSLLRAYAPDSLVFLVRPKIHTHFGFGGLNHKELLDIFEKKVLLSDMDSIACLWEYYKTGNIHGLRKQAQVLQDRYPFIVNAVDAHIERIPHGNDPGRPVRALKEIMKDFETNEFGPVFREFNRRESIYGFGDLQVRRLFESIKN